MIPCRCRKCGRKLTKPESIALGYGPVCIPEEVYKSIKPYKVYPNRYKHTVAKSRQKLINADETQLDEIKQFMLEYGEVE